jgi:hypothetical protein
MCHLHWLPPLPGRLFVVRRDCTRDVCTRW